MSFGTSPDRDEDDVAFYRHEETGEEIHPKRLHYHLNWGNWDGEQLSEDSGAVWLKTDAD